jgi:hypothetical protein
VFVIVVGDGEEIQKIGRVDGDLRLTLVKMLPADIEVATDVGRNRVENEVLRAASHAAAVVAILGNSESLRVDDLQARNGCAEQRYHKTNSSFHRGISIVNQLSEMAEKSACCGGRDGYKGNPPVTTPHRFDPLRRALGVYVHILRIHQISF